ncbi:MAG: iron deficiency-induced protein A [Cyclobacteriaceae bacterium]|nr:MAG: iron deficiency-induced protein A [Cyclobacteriaceae bacterium]
MCTPEKGENAENQQVTEEVVNVYTHRHYEPDQKLFEAFEKSTGIKVNVVNASADELINRMEMEAEASPADVLITVDAGRLHRAKEKKLLQPIESQILNENIPPVFREKQGYWFGLTYRARVIAYALDRVDPGAVPDYESLTDPQWKEKVLIRSSGNIYNQSLLASIIAGTGTENARDWASGVVANMAREPKGNDRDQVKAVAAGVGDLAVLNTYYIGKMLTSDNAEEVAAGEAIGVIFPNQSGRGTHINVSGAGVASHAPNKENAIRFIEYLSSADAQKVFAEANFEFPVRPGTAKAALLESWGDFKIDTLDLGQLGVHNREAVMLFDEVGWK